MSTNNCSINTPEFKIDLTCFDQPVDQCRKQSLPEAGLHPSAKTVVDGFAFAKFRREIFPRETRVKNKQNPVDYLTVWLPRTTCLATTLSSVVRNSGRISGVVFYGNTN
jgi:hypothetical protein